ncbi:hypothetical protein [Stappia stellulata]|uniref:hypothetical protein n=1 Tax=Stappia stellulata TaxID=71235 RepID=UPI0005630B52|nr:hypothetical protein [Stappia stellulata]
MGSSTLPDNFEIAPGHRVKGWKSLTLNQKNSTSSDWTKAIAILDTRIRRRFIEPAQLLIDAENGKGRGINGFAVLAIDFLLIETIQGFREGLTNHNRKSKALFKAFWTNWQVFKDCVPQGANADDLAVSVYEQGRCALHHTGSTDRVIVRKSGKMFVFHNDGRIVINRTLLHKQLVTAFDVYIAALKDPANTDMREKFKQKMDHICS